MKVSRVIARFIDFFYFPFLRRYIPRDTFRYAISGGTNMVLDAVLYYVLYHYVLCERFIDLGFVVMSPHIAALFLVFPVTFFNGFWLNKYVNFRSSKLEGKTQLFRYILSVCGAILVNYLLMKLFVEVCGIFPTPSKILTTVVSTVYSYTMQRHFAFKKSH